MVVGGSDDGGEVDGEYGVEVVKDSEWWWWFLGCWLGWFEGFWVLMTEWLTDGQSFAIVGLLSQLKIEFNTLSVKIFSFSAFLVQRLPFSTLVLLVWRKAQFC